LLLYYPYREMVDPLEVTATSHPRIVPAGPKTIKVKDQWGRWTAEEVIGYVSQPYIEIHTDLGLRSVDPRIVYIK